LEALKKALTELSTPEVSVRILHGAVGAKGCKGSGNG